jgi:hypothetical protein
MVHVTALLHVTYFSNSNINNNVFRLFGYLTTLFNCLCRTASCGSVIANHKLKRRWEFKVGSIYGTIPAYLRDTKETHAMSQHGQPVSEPGTESRISYHHIYFPVLIMGMFIKQ